MVSSLIFGTFWPLLLLAQTPQNSGNLTAREMFYATRDEARPAAAAPAAAPKPARSKAVRRAPTAAVPAPAEARKRPAPGQEPARSNSPVVPAAYSLNPLGIRYSIVKRVGGDSEAVSPGAVFHSGDRIRLSVEVNDDGYLYIVHKGSSGTWKMMFPSAEVGEGSNRVQRGHTYDLPPGSVFSFVGKPGAEKLFVVLAREPEPDLEKMIYSLGGAAEPPRDAQPSAPEAPRPVLLTASARPIDDALVGQLRNLYARDLIIEKVDEEAPGKQPDKAVYVVNPTGSADSRVVADITLTHQ